MLPYDPLAGSDQNVAIKGDASTGRGGWRTLHRKRVLLPVLAVLMILAGWWLRRIGYLQPEALVAFTQSYSVTAPLLFIVIYAVCVVAIVPTLPLNLAAGVLWGPLIGGIIATAGSGLGAVSAFLVARSAVGNSLRKHLKHPAAVWAMDELEHGGWKIVAFVRLNPSFPGFINYVLGFSPIHFTTFLWSSLLFLFPPTMLFAAMGWHFGNIVLTGDLKNIIYGILFISFAVILTATGKIYMRWRRQARQQENHD